MFLHKRFCMLLALTLLPALALSQSEAEKSQAAIEKSQADIEKSQANLEAQLADARARLEAAAREVAELSGQLTGPIMQDYMITGMAGMPSRAMLGINLGDDRQGKEGVRVQSVTPGGPASDAGLRAGDVIIGVDGKNLRSKDKSSAAALVEYMHTVRAGDKVKVDYLRDGKTQSVQVTTEAFGPGQFMVRSGRGMPDRVFAMAVPAPVGAVPVLPPTPFTAAFPAVNVLDMELVAMTPKLGKYFGTDKGVLVVRAPGDSELKLEDGDVILDIDGRAPQNGAHALRILGSYQPGEKVAINVLRDRKPVKLSVTVSDRGPMTIHSGGNAMWFNAPVPPPEVKPLPGAPKPVPPAQSEGPT